MSRLLLKLRRKLLYRIVGKLTKFADPYTVVRNNLIEKPEFEDAFRALDDHDFTTALEIFSDLAEKGNPAAQNNLGVFYEIGTGVLSRQDALAEKWYRKAAEQGLAEAQYNLAAILAADAMAGQAGYMTDDEGERFVEAYMWLILANTRGHPMAPPSLGRLEPHMMEKQLEEAEKRAREWNPTK